MTENNILMWIIIALGVIEIGLIISIHQLKKTLERMTEKVKKFEGLVSVMGTNIASIYNLFRGFREGEIKVKGSTPIGSVDLSVQLGHEGTEK